MSYNPTNVLPRAAWIRLSSVVISNQLTVDFVFTGSFKMYMVRMSDITASAAPFGLGLILSSDGGQNFLQGTNEYAVTTLGTQNTGLQGEGLLLRGIVLAQTLILEATESINGVVYIHNPLQATAVTCISADIVQGGLGVIGVVGSSVTALHLGGPANINAIRFLVDELELITLASGSMTLYGLVI